MTDHIEQMRTNRQDFDSKVESIRNHLDLSDQAKQRYLQEAYEEASWFHKEHAAEHAAEQGANIANLEREVFDSGVPKSGAVQDKMAATIACRDALSRANAAVASADSGNGPEALQGLIDRAERSGDEQLGFAAYHLSREKGFYSVGDAYASGRPKVKDLWSRYSAACNVAESVEGKLFGAGTVGALAPAKPREL